MNIATASMKRIGALAAAVSMCSFVLSGCSAMGGKSGDSSDVCAAQRAELANSEEHYGVAVVTGAVTGALLGAGAAALIGAASGQNVGKSAAIGAATGAVAGGIGGYFIEKKRTTPDPQALAGAIQSDIAAENAQIDKATVAFAQLRQCRFAAADRVKVEYAQGTIPREEAVNRLDDQRRRFDEDIEAAEEIGVKMKDKAKEFEYASDQLVKADPQAEAAIQSQPVQEEAPAAQPSAKKPAAPKPQRALPPKTEAVVETAQATQTNLNKTKGFGNEVVQAKAEAASQFSLEGTVGQVSHGTEVC